MRGRAAGLQRLRAAESLSRVGRRHGQIERLTYNKDVDRYPHCLDNGLIGYMRWDYQERFWQWPHALWTIHPDGTMNDGLFKVHFRDPQSVREPRSIPGSQKLVVIACGHHSPPEGAVAVVDPSQGANNPMGLRYVTPRCSPLEGGLGPSPNRAGRRRRRPRRILQDALAVVREEAFWSSYAFHSPRKTELCGLLHRRLGEQGADAPRSGDGRAASHAGPHTPAAARRSPSHVDPDSSYAVCYLDDVNRDMPGVKPGTVRYLRISEQLQWYFGKNDNSGPDTLDAGHATFAELRLLDLVAGAGHRHRAGGEGRIGLFQGARGPGAFTSRRWTRT